MSDIVKFDWSKLNLPAEVQKQYETLAEKMTTGDSSLESDRAYKWRPAFLKMKQATTTDPAMPDSAKLGDFFHKGGTLPRPVKVVLVYAWTSRTRFVPNEDSFPSCRSENVSQQGKVDNSINVYGDPCATCWKGERPYTKGKKSNCNDVLNTIVIPETLDGVYQVNFSKASHKKGKEFTDMARATTHPWSRFYLLNSEIKKRDKGGGQWAEWSVSTLSGPDAEVPEHLKQFATYVAAQMKAVRQEQRTMKLEKREESEAPAFDLDGEVAETVEGSVKSGGYKDTI